MSTTGITLNTNTSSGQAITISGLASGIDTSAIVSSLMTAEREPLTRLTDEQEKISGQQKTLQEFQLNLQQLTFAADEFALPSTFESAQTAVSSEPTRVAVTASPGAAIGGHEIEVLQLADSAQRTFTFTSPAAEETITVNGREIKLKAAETAAELASKLNSGGEGSGVYATVLANGSLVLSSRSTGAAGAVAVTGGALAEVAGTAKEGKNAEFVLDGVHETSESNVLTEAIPGVTMTLQALTTVGSPVSIDVQPPTTSPAALESQVQSFIKLYNSTISAIQKQITTRPPQKPSSATEFATGTLFGDGELTSVLDTMRQAMYEPLAGLPSGVNSLADIGVSTGAATGGGESSQASLEGQLTLDPAKLAEAVKNDPEAVEKMLGEWSKNFQSLVGGVAEPGGTLEGRANGDGAQVAELTNQITSMTESLNQREHALIETYAELEAVISQNSAQSSWLAQQSGSSSGG